MKHSTVWKVAIAASTCIGVIAACYLMDINKQTERARPRCMKRSSFGLIRNIP